MSKVGMVWKKMWSLLAASMAALVLAGAFVSCSDGDDVTLENDGTLVSDTTTKRFTFTGSDLKIEWEAMTHTGFNSTPDVMASGGAAGELIDEKSRAEAIITFPAGTYAGYVWIKAPSSSNDAFYVQFGDSYVRCYADDPIPSGYAKTSRTPIKLTADSETTVRMVIQKDSPEREGEAGMFIDYVLFSKITEDARVNSVSITADSTEKTMNPFESVALKANPSVTGNPLVTYTWSVDKDDGASLSVTTGENVALTAKKVTTDTSVTVTVVADDGVHHVSNTYSVTVKAGLLDNLTPYFTEGTAVETPAVTAKWDFSELSGNAFTEGTALSTVSTMIDAAYKTGTGAAIDFNDTTWGAAAADNKGLRIQVKSKTLSTMEEGLSFRLTVDVETNLVIRAHGTGNVSPNQYLALVDKTGRILVAKDRLYYGKTIEFVIPGLAAGTYTVYVSAASIFSIDCGVSATDLPALPAPVTSVVLYEGESEANQSYTLEAIMGSLTLRAKDGSSDDDITNDVTWASSNEAVATVHYGVIAPITTGTAVITATIDTVAAVVVVTVTPCTKAIVTFIDKNKLPAKDETVDFANLSENVKAAFTAIISGSTEITVSQATMTKGAALTSQSPSKDISLTKAGDSNTGGNSYGLHWKDGASSSAPITNLNAATLSITVFPASGKTLKLTKIQAQSYTGGGDGAIIITPTIGETTGTPMSVTKAWTIDSAAQDSIISSATEITLSFDKRENKTAEGVSFRMQDLQFIFEVQE